MFYKILNEDGTVYHHGGAFRWPLPIENADGSWTPGVWTPEIEGELVPCQNGYHLCRPADLVAWLGPAIFEAEYRGEAVEADNKIVVRQARLLRRLENWNERTARLFACDCAEHVLSIFERAYPADSRPRECVETARRYADGQATADELFATARGARDAARDARAAAWDAAWHAAWAAREAAWIAARDAAWVARDATWDARDAAWAARGAAWHAAKDARGAEREWQLQRLLALLT